MSAPNKASVLEPRGNIGYVVACSQTEADGIAGDRPDLIHADLASANRHLDEVKSPPTDPYYAALYKVCKVRATK